MAQYDEQKARNGRYERHGRDEKRTKRNDEPHAHESHDERSVAAGLSMVEEYHVVTEVVTKYESPELEPLIQVGESERDREPHGTQEPERSQTWPLCRSRGRARTRNERKRGDSRDLRGGCLQCPGRHDEIVYR